VTMKLLITIACTRTPISVTSFAKLRPLWEPVKQALGPKKLENSVILEVSILDVRKGEEGNFELAFNLAQKIISNMEGYISHQLKKCIEKPNRYILLVNWQTIEDHTVRFRESKQYQEWKILLHHFYDPFPSVEHYTDIALK